MLFGGRANSRICADLRNRLWLEYSAWPGMNVVLISQSIVNGNGGGAGGYITSTFGHERCSWEPEQMNQTELLYQIDRQKKRMHLQLLPTLSWVCLTIIVRYLTKTLCWYALSCIDAFELLRMILHQSQKASPNTLLCFIGARQEAIYKTDMQPSPRRLKDGADLQLMAFFLLLLLWKKSDNRNDFLLKQNKQKITISPEMLSPVKESQYLYTKGACVSGSMCEWGPWCI